MAARAVMWGVSPPTMRRRTTAHVKAIRERLRSIEKALSPIDEDPVVPRLVKEFLDDVDRWERQIDELISYFEEEVD